MKLHSLPHDDPKSVKKHPYREKFYDAWRFAEGMGLNPTIYFLEALEYHTRAEKQQLANVKAWKRGKIGASLEAGCPLQDNVRIYDTVYRWSAGFSNVSQELMLGVHNPKHAFNVEHDLAFQSGGMPEEERAFLLLVHRICGSGASFATVGDPKLPIHGWYNTPVPWLADQHRSMTEMVGRLKTYSGPMFSSIGNQIPPFNKPTDGYTTGGRQYLCEIAPQLANHTMRYLQDRRSRIGLQDLVVHLLDWHTDMGWRRFKFVMTAWAMDLAEYWPNLVDDQSDCFHGKNAMEAVNLCFDRAKSKPRGQSFYDVSTRFMADWCKTRPMDVEDAAPGCDLVRWLENYIQPKGYANVDRTKVFNHCYIKHPHGRQPWKLGTSDWVWGDGNA
ncbi:hypothetical protein UFOVP435_77 [uncultured Caudovirales phage]|uniref:Uncharacterized protein n=1 Tax=uncultured Caudovirales phage TaxID=2100421 RepID=A0A6J5MAK4_9CAUD|nr:hypothetical protein UFOVP435_77 [uncultured Caudovirales phage]